MSVNIISDHCVHLEIGRNITDMSNNMRQKMIRLAPSEITYKNMRFLIMDRPTDATIPGFIEVGNY